MKRLKSIISLICTTVLAITILLPAAPAQAAAALFVNQSMVEVGQSITVSGSGFDPGSTEQWYANIIFSRLSPSTFSYSSGVYEILKTVLINANGSFAATVTIPSLLTKGTFEAVGSGTYYIIITYHTNNPNKDYTAVIQKTSISVLGGDLNVSADTGSPGTKLYLSGSGYSSGEDLIVKLDSQVVSIIEGSPYANAAGTFSNIVVYVPAATVGPHGFTVTGDTSNHQSGAMFTIQPGLLFKDEIGTASSPIDISGGGFAANSVYTLSIDGTPVQSQSNTTNANGAFYYTFPAGTFTNGDHVITCTDSAGNTAQSNYTVYDSSLSINPTSGSPNWDVTLSGSGFEKNSTVTISYESLDSKYNATATTDANGEFTKTVTVLWGKMGTWAFTVTDGTNSKTVDFEVNTSSNINPTTSVVQPGHVGTPVAVAESGFTPGRTVSVTFDGVPIATATAAADGTFSASFLTPETSNSGPLIIEATDGTNVAKFGFYMETTVPPQITLVEPLEGEKAKSETFFDWADITKAEEPSGVTYTLEIATDSNFTSIVKTVSDLAVSEYTMPEKLNAAAKDAPYYWRVKAIDGASNQGPWTAATSFYVGFGFNLPQGIIYVIIVVVALGLSVFTFWLGRKTAYY